jgi:outer membrane protein assembly factor BamB
MVTTDEPVRRKPLRLWPGVVIVILQWLLRFGLPVVAPEATVLGVFAGFLGGVAIVLWWLLFSRAPWAERLGAVVLMIVSFLLMRRFLHESIATGAEGMLFGILVIPVLSLAFVAWAVACRRLSDGPRRAAMAATILLACGVFTLLKTGGFTGDFENDLMWRWAQTPEERLLARRNAETASGKSGAISAPASPDAAKPKAGPDADGKSSASAPAPAGAEAVRDRTSAKADDRRDSVAPAPPATETPADWPGFRGRGRDGIIHGMRIETDWSASGPVELWRRPIGPGWSSVAVAGDLLYTQEQRGDDEVVASYKLRTGEPVWRHSDKARFWESNAGAGPRGTPTLSNGRVYTLGATGIVNALDAANGAVMWSRNAASDTGAKLPDWGFSGSPLVLNDLLIVAASGALVAYDLSTGSPRWLGPVGGEGYTSPHRVTIGGVEQILHVSGNGVTSVAPADGKQLWQHSWPGYPIVQPALTADGDVLLSVREGIGTRRIAVAHGPGGWTVEERWTSNGLKPYFNDFVVHQGHAFGFDGGILACIDLGSGARKWKGGRYGHGQLVLLSDQDLMLVLSEEGELALVEATPERFKELARFRALEGKTWNHPVLAGDVLIVRNAEEMAAFRLSAARR